MFLTKEEIQAICYYEGDVEAGADPFWSDPKAYVTLNAILFDGIETEIARSAEGRFLNPSFLEDDGRLLEVYKNLLSVFHKSISEKEQTVYRVERLADMKMFIGKGMWTSFISTSKAGFLKSYQDKKDLVLLKIHLDEGTPCADFGKLLNNYLKEEEAEILLPPYLPIRIKERKPSEEEQSIRDGYGNPPAMYLDIEVGREYAVIESDPYIPDMEKCRRVYDCLNLHEPLSEEDIKEYIRWKHNIQKRVNQFCR